MLLKKTRVAVKATGDNAATMAMAIHCHGELYAVLEEVRHKSTPCCEES